MPNSSVSKRRNPNPGQTKADKIAPNGDTGTMKEATKRSIFRWLHLAFGLPIIGYIYDSPADTPYYASTIRFFFLPALILTGLWMWKGHVVRRLLSKNSPPRPNQSPSP